jgi:hypothetical protein
LKRDDFESNVGSLLDDLAKRYPAESLGPEDPSPRPEDDALVHELVRSFLMWEAPRAGVAGAMARVREAVVDYNELRVFLPEDLASLLGARYPRAQERCLRLRAAMREVFRRENGLTLAHLRDEAKRASRAYLDSLPGTVGFVAARVSLVCCEAHAFPVDGVLQGVLENAGVLEKGLDADTASGKMERLVRASDSLLAYRRLERLLLDGPAVGRSKGAARSRAGSGAKAGKP